MADGCIQAQCPKGLKLFLSARLLQRSAAALLVAAALPAGLGAMSVTAAENPATTSPDSAGPSSSTLPASEVAQGSGSDLVEHPGSIGKVEATARKKGQPSIYGMATKPGFYTLVEQTSTWVFPRTGAAWGTGAAVGATFVGVGMNGNIKGGKDNLLSWSAQFGPAFRHVYDVPGNDRTPLRIDLFSTLSPLLGDDLNIYTIWRGIVGDDQLGQTRFQNTVRAGIVYSFAKSRIIPDAVELINLPEKGFYARVEPSWVFGLDGQLTQVLTQAYLGLSETWYPFTFAVEVGPQFIQTARRELQTNLGSFIDVGYVINSKTRAYLRYRPSLSFGGNEYPAANQVMQAGLNYRF